MPKKSDFTKLMLPTVFTFLFLVFFCLPDTAHAGYLDPGSGSVLVQGIIAVMAFFGRFIDRIKKFLSLS